MLQSALYFYAYTFLVQKFSTIYLKILNCHLQATVKSDEGARAQGAETQTKSLEASRQ
jgi:hypothetical protein